MAIGDLITGTSQLEIGESFLVGGSRARILSALSGAGLPSIVTDDLESHVADGAVGGRDRYGPRQLVASIILNADTPTQLNAETDLLAAVCHRLRTGTTPLAIRLGGAAPRIAHVRPRGLEIPWDDVWTPHGLARNVVATFDALDPYLYATTETTTVLTAPASGTSGSATVTNGGTGRTRPTVTIVGPATNPRIANAADGLELRLSGVFGGADTIVVDLAAQTVELNGVADNTILAADTEWPSLLVGDNPLTYTRDDSPATASTATVVHRDGYLSAI